MTKLRRPSSQRLLEVGAMPGLEEPGGRLLHPPPLEDTGSLSAFSKLTDSSYKRLSHQTAHHMDQRSPASAMTMGVCAFGPLPSSRPALPSCCSVTLQCPQRRLNPRSSSLRRR